MLELSPNLFSSSGLEGDPSEDLLLLRGVPQPHLLECDLSSAWPLLAWGRSGGLGLLVQLSVFHHSLHRGHEVLHLGRLPHAPLEVPGEEDAAGDGQSHVSPHHLPAQEEEAVDHHGQVEGDEPVQPHSEPAGGGDEGEPGGAVDILEYRVSSSIVIIPINIVVIIVVIIILVVPIIIVKIIININVVIIVIFIIVVVIIIIIVVIMLMLELSRSTG